jgi:hypothetical protein
VGSEAALKVGIKKHLFWTTSSLKYLHSIVKGRYRYGFGNAKYRITKKDKRNAKAKIDQIYRDMAKKRKVA